MNSLVSNEMQLMTEIDRLREQFQDTPELYREVCVLLFFRHGITPTANKLYQLVRKGSMSAPAEALSKFWDDLRDKSRVRIEHPDLPEALKTAAGELTAALWSTAQAAANESLAVYFAEAQATVAEAKAMLAAAEAERNVNRQVLERVQSELNQEHERFREVEKKLAAADATNAALNVQLQHAKSESNAQQHRLDAARRDFAADLDKLRGATELAEERFRAAETRALLEIDRERTTNAKLQKELEAARSAASQAEERHRAELAASQMQLGDMRQKMGVLEGNLQAAIANRDLTLREIKALQAQLTEANAALEAARLEEEAKRKSTVQSKKFMSAQGAIVRSPRSRRKTKVE